MGQAVVNQRILLLKIFRRLETNSQYELDNAQNIDYYLQRKVSIYREIDNVTKK